MEGVDVYEVGQTEAGQTARSFHSDRSADTDDEGLLSLGETGSAHETPLILGSFGRNKIHQDVHVGIHLAKPTGCEAQDGPELKQALLNRALFAFRRVAPHTVGFASFCDVPGLDTTLAEVSCMAAFTVALLTLVPYLVI